MVENRDQVYLMAVGALEDPVLMEEAASRLDPCRRKKVECCRRQEDRLRSLGAGLLLQFALMQWGKRDRRYAEENDFFVQLEALRVAERLGRPGELDFFYGENGKPYLRNGPFFSLSHSGEYAACAVSERECGLDIQERRPSSWEKMARRFYTRSEQEQLAACGSREEQERFFYKLWTRKEAYGKLTGGGLRDGLALCVEMDMEHGETAFWDYDGLRGYQVCYCVRRQSRG